MQKTYSSPEAEEIGPRQSLSGIPASTTSTSGILTGILKLIGIPPIASPQSNNPDKLPDLIVNQDTDNIEGDVQAPLATDPVSTEEELEAANILLSLDDVRDDTLDDDENSRLMPVGVPSNVIDVAHVPLKLDQMNVDNAIAGIVQASELENVDKDKPSMEQDTINKSGAPEDTTTQEDDKPKCASPTQGSFKIKTHALEKKSVNKRNYKCSVCGLVKPSIQQINEHHLKDHKPQICAICGCMFALVSSLARHMYDHDEQCYQCDACNYSSHFES